MSPLSPEELRQIDAYWRAANYLSIGQIYLLDNALLREPLQPEHIKPRLLGHWGTTPGLNLIYAHLNRVIRDWDLDAVFVAGPGHGGPGVVANAYLEGTYTEVYPSITRDAEGMTRLFRQFSFPGGIPSHASPETPGSFHEGGELGYSLAHAYGAAFDNPDLLVFCVVGDGEAETGPPATSWHSNKFLDPAQDGAVLPILHLNGYKIANPTVLARIPDEELVALFEGYGHRVHVVAGDDPDTVHQLLASTLDEIVEEIQNIQRAAKQSDTIVRPRWPMVILRTPKGWTGPKFVDGLPVTGQHHRLAVVHQDRRDRRIAQRREPVESRMRVNVHVRFGGRARETDQPKGRHRALVRPHTGIQAKHRKHASTPVRKGRPTRREFEYVRHGTASLVASLDVATGRVRAKDIARNNSVTFIAFLEEIDASIEESLEVHVVLDNGSSHTSKATKAWFAEHPRFVVHHTPAHASWLNLVECFFSILTRKVLRRGEFTSRDDLVEKMLNFIEHHSKSAKPFKWVYDAKVAA